MSKVKKKLKREVDFCALCCKRFYNIDEKHAVRINSFKNTKRTNLLIMCKDCSRAYPNNVEDILNDNILNVIKYLKHFDRKYHYIVIKNIIRKMRANR